MAWYDNLLVWVLMTVDMVGPAILLLLLRRWTRRWWTAFIGVVVTAPVVAFFLTGGVAWAATYVRVVIQGDTTVPDENGKPVPEYLGFIFYVCGIYGVMFAGTGFLMSLPLVILWRVAHSASFKRFARSGPAGTAAAPVATELGQ